MYTLMEKIQPRPKHDSEYKATIKKAISVLDDVMVVDAFRIDSERMTLCLETEDKDGVSRNIIFRGSFIGYIDGAFLRNIESYSEGDIFKFISIDDWSSQYEWDLLLKHIIGKKIILCGRPKHEMGPSNSNYGQPLSVIFKILFSDDSILTIASPVFHIQRLS